MDLVRRSKAVGFSSTGPCVRDKFDHELVSFNIDGNRRKISDVDSSNNRKGWFPKDRIRKAIDFDVIHAQASLESDKCHILNAIIEEYDFDAQPPASHPKYENLNNVVKAGFSRLNKFGVGKNKDKNEVNLNCSILYKSQMTKLNFDFFDYRYGEADESLVISYLTHLPLSLVELEVNNIFTGRESMRTLYSLPSQLPNLASMVIVNTNYDNAEIDVLFDSLKSESGQLVELKLLQHLIERDNINKIQAIVDMKKGAGIPFEFIQNHR
eukprot:gene6319-8704_t